VVRKPNLLLASTSEPLSGIEPDPLLSQCAPYTKGVPTGYHHSHTTTVVYSRAKVRIPILWASGSCVQVKLSIMTNLSSSNDLEGHVPDTHSHQDVQSSVQECVLVSQYSDLISHNRPQLLPLLLPRLLYHERL
jgi:hypothetical protein